ncbi:MAG TPA: hypothetical protein PLO51_00730 [Candidatus Micrarchaeota archaeon]|nr:hypothetical protein [Candidatus Micrarchaeota archaeon]
MERGVSIKLTENGGSGEFVCSVNPKHRFKIGASGFLESMPEL